MGYVPITCHICEGPADLSTYDTEEGDELPNSPAQGRVEWMLERIGILEASDLSSLWGFDDEVKSPVVRTDKSLKSSRNRQPLDRCSISDLQTCWRQDDNVPIPLGPWDEMAGFELDNKGLTSFVPFSGGPLSGLACHRACYNLLVDRLKYRIKMRDVRHLATREYEAILMGGDYGGILKYQEQVQSSLSCCTT